MTIAQYFNWEKVDGIIVAERIFFRYTFSEVNHVLFLFYLSRWTLPACFCFCFLWIHLLFLPGRTKSCSCTSYWTGSCSQKNKLGHTLTTLCLSNRIEMYGAMLCNTSSLYVSVTYSLFCFFPSSHYATITTSSSLVTVVAQWCVYIFSTSWRV